MRFTVCLVLVIGALYVLAGIALYAFQNRLLYVPESAIKTTPAAAGIPYEEVALVASDGVRLTGWYMPLADARGTVLFCHGNAGNISYLLDVAAGAHASWGWGFCCSTIAATARVTECLRRRGPIGMRPRRGTIWSPRRGCPRSASSSSAARWVGRLPHGWRGKSSRPPCSWRRPLLPYPSWAESCIQSFRSALLARYEYPTLEYLKQVQCPVLVSHSRGDMFIVFEHGQRLYEATNQPKAFTELRGGHSSAFSEDAATYEAGVAAFLTEVLGW